jgi:hypothetical protein
VNRLRRIVLAVLDFIVGDDWRVAAGVAVVLAVTAAVATSSVAAWWLVPLGVVVLLGDSLRRAAR